MGRRKGGVGKGIRNKIKSRRRPESNIQVSSRQKGIEYHSVVAEGYADGGGPAILSSVIDKNDFGEMLDRALLSQKTFHSERGAAEIVTTEDDAFDFVDEIYAYENVPLPRRPLWDKTMTRHELNQNEEESFLNWRRNIALTSEKHSKIITPYEKNLEFWRQLWRVMERSDVVVQIVDARNPLLFRSKDLEMYTEELSKDKRNFLLINKSDLLSEPMRDMWAEYFNSLGLKFVFFSAFLEQISLDLFSKAKREQRFKGLEFELRNLSDDDEDDGKVAYQPPDEEDKQNVEDDSQHLETSNKFSSLIQDDGSRKSDEDVREINVEDRREISQNTSQDSKATDINNNPLDDNNPNDSEQETFSDDDDEDEDESSILCTSKLATVSELLACLKRTCGIISEQLEDEDSKHVEDEDGDRSSSSSKQLVVGMVGYPNVGKSSVINVMCGGKRVAVAGTPGKTKHFQTLNISDDIQVVDCPGLVFPTYLNSRADLVCNGILPIDRLRDVVEPTRVVCQRIRLDQLLARYRGIKPDQVKKGVVGTYSLLREVAELKGWFSRGGVPNESRAGRLILKDYVTGKLVYCHPPPHLNKNQRESFLDSIVCDVMIMDEEMLDEFETGEPPKRLSASLRGSLYDNKLGNSKRKHHKKMRRGIRDNRRINESELRRRKIKMREEFMSQQNEEDGGGS